jgi:outer membrane protein OmpA-like peptidoglycan-associated protein
MTRHEGAGWSSPEALSFINTQANDEYISVPARGDIIYYTGLYKEKLHHLYMAVIPDELRGKKVAMITGRVSFDDPGAAAAGARIQAYDAESSTLVSIADMDPADGSFYMVLSEGRVYDFSVFPRAAGQLYHSDLIDLRAMERARWDKPDIKISEFGPGERIQINTLVFEQESPDLKIIAETELKRLAGFLKKNSGHQIEVAVLTDTTVWSPVDQLPSDAPMVNEPELEEEAEEDEWIDDSSWFGSDEPDDVVEEVGNVIDSLDSATIDRWPANPDLGLDRALNIVNELQQKGVDIAKIKPAAYHVGAFESMAGDSLNYWVEIRILD